MSYANRSTWMHGTLFLLLAAGLAPFCVKVSPEGGSVVLQKGDNDCAPAAAAMLLEAAAQPARIEQIRAEFTLTPDGASVSQVVKVLRAHNLDVSAWQLDRSRMSDIPVPSILFVDGSHFIVLDSVAENRAYIRDPASGRRVLSARDLYARWDGVTVAAGGHTGPP